MARRILYVIRHGDYHERDCDEEADLTEAQVTINQDGGLTPVGIQQSQLLAQRLKALPVTAIHCSSLPRATETAQIIARALPGVPVHRSRELWECVPGLPPEFAKTFTGDLAAEEKRAANAFDRYFKAARGQDKYGLVVCHGNLIRYFVCRVLGVPPETWLNMGTSNCGLSVVLIKSDGRMRLMSYNDVGHLPDDLKT